MLQRPSYGFDENDVVPLAVMLSDVVTGADCADRLLACKWRPAVFSGKIPDWTAQIPAVPVEPINASSRAAAMPRPRVSGWT